MTSKDQAETSVLFELIGARYERRSLARRFAPDPATIPDITVELVLLHLYDELGTVRAGSVA